MRKLATALATLIVLIPGLAPAGRPGRGPSVEPAAAVGGSAGNARHSTRAARKKPARTGRAGSLDLSGARVETYGELRLAAGLGMLDQHLRTGINPGEHGLDVSVPDVPKGGMVVVKVQRPSKPVDYHGGGAGALRRAIREAEVWETAAVLTEAENQARPTSHAGIIPGSEESRRAPLDYVGSTQHLLASRVEDQFYTVTKDPLVAARLHATKPVAPGTLARLHVYDAEGELRGSRELVVAGAHNRIESRVVPNETYRQPPASRVLVRGGGNLEAPTPWIATENLAITPRYRNRDGRMVAEIVGLSAVPQGTTVEVWEDRRRKVGSGYQNWSPVASRTVGRTGAFRLVIPAGRSGARYQVFWSLPDDAAADATSLRVSSTRREAWAYVELEQQQTEPRYFSIPKGPRGKPSGAKRPYVPLELQSSKQLGM